MSYIGQRPDTVVSRNTFSEFNYTATNAQTTFTGADTNGLTLSYNAGNVEVFLNGVRLEEADFTATNGTSVVLASGATTGDLLSVKSAVVFETNDAVSKASGGTFSNSISVTGSVTATSFSGDGSSLSGISTDLVNDITPQLGGNLDTNGKNIAFGDSASAGTDDTLTFGADADLQIYFDGNSKIADVGDGKLELHSNGTGVFIQKGATEYMAKFETDGAVTLYHDNSPKLATSSTGVTVTGNIANASGDLTIDIVGDITFDAGGGDVNFKDDGTQYGFLAKYNNDLWIGNSISDGDVTIRGNDGGSNISALSFDMSNLGFASFNANAFFNESASDVDFRIKSVNETNMFYVDANTDRIGIGTSDPRGKLQIGSGIGGSNVPSSHELVFGANNSDITFLSDSSGTSVDGTIGAWNTVYNFQNSKIVFDKPAGNLGQILFYTNTGSGIEARMKIQHDGKVGIGETMPDCKLHVRGAASGGGRILIQTDGAFAGTDEAMLDFRHYDDTGDPSGRISLKGTTNYAGDMVFKVRQGGTSGAGGAGLQEHMRIQTGGYVTTPNQPSCSIYNCGFGSSATSWSSAGSGSANGGLVGVAHHNNGNHYSTSTGYFTAPVAGYYLCNLNVYGKKDNSHGDNAGYWWGYFQKNGGYYAGNYIMEAYYNSGDYDQGASISSLIYLAANDTVRPYMGSYIHGISVYGPNTSFNCHLLG